MSCFDSYQISLIYEATNDQISEFDQFGSSIYSLSVCDSETDIDCDDSIDIEQLQVNKILSVTKNGSNLIFDMYVQLPLNPVDTRQCILKAIEHFTMDDIIETLYINLSSANVSIRNAVDDLYVLLDVLSNVVNDCNAFELALTNIITKANELKGLLILEIGYDDEIEHIDELIEYVNSVILSIPAPSVDKYQTLDFCITALNDNLIHDFRVSPLEPYIITINDHNYEYTITRVPTRIIKVNHLFDDQYTVYCVNNENEIFVSNDNECLDFAQIFIPKKISITIFISPTKFQNLNEITNIRLKINNVLFPINYEFVQATTLNDPSIVVVIDEESITNYITSNNIQNYVTNTIQTDGLFKALEIYSSSIVGTVEYRYAYWKTRNSCQIGLGCNDITFNDNNNRVYHKMISLLDFNVKTQEYSDFTVEMCDGCDVETIIDEGYDPQILSSVFSLIYADTNNVEYTFYVDESDVDDDTEDDIDINIDEVKDIVKPITDRRSWNDPIPPTEPEDDQCLTPPSNHHWVDVNFNIAGEPLRIGVGQYRQNVNFTQAEHEGVMYSSQILLINDWNGNPASTYIESIYIVVERTVSVLEFARLVYNLINISPTSQEYIDIKNELINQGMILDQNDTYKLIVMYRYANDCSGICINPQTLPSTNFTVDVLGLPAEVLIYIEENGEFSFHSAFDDEFGLSLIDNVYYMLTTLNSNVKFTASKTYYIGCNNEEIEFLINFTFKSSIVGINN